MTQQSLIFDQLFEKGASKFPVNAGSYLRDRGIEDALERAKRIKAGYVDQCLEAIKEFSRGARITSEDIREKAGDVPSEINHSVLAGIMKTAQKQGMLMITHETTTAKRASLHAKRLSVWIRL